MPNIKSRVLILTFAWLFLAVMAPGLFTNTSRAQAPDEPRKVLPPEGPGAYHGAFAEFGANEDKVTRPAIKKFEDLTEKPLAWAYFSNNWFRQKDENECPRAEIKFPADAVQTIWTYRSDHPIIPFIRMMPRSNMPNAEESHALDPVYTMQRIINGAFDDELRQWARAAKATNIPLMVEFGTEVNGDWFSWNGTYNGGATKDKYGDATVADGPERFRDAYRHIIDLFRGEGVRNITWVYHVNAASSPNEDWNSVEAYYPGDDYIDWIGVSVYGPQKRDEEYRAFTEVLTREVYDRLSRISSSRKPLAVLEFGINKHDRKAEWVAGALRAIRQDYPLIRGISYWHSKWKDDDETVDLRLEGNSLKNYKDAVKDSYFSSAARVGRP